MVCPDRTIKEVGQKSASVLYQERKNCAALSTGLDARIMSNVSSSGGLSSCDSSATTIRLGNMGNTALTSAKLTFLVDGIAQKTMNWTGNLASYESTLLSGIKVGAAAGGVHTLKVQVSNPNGSTDVNDKNDTLSTTFTVNLAGNLPFSEGFETISGLPAATWKSDKTTANGSNWSIATNTGSSGTKSCMINNMANVAGNVSTLDHLNSYSFSSTSSPSITFKVAYQRKTTTNNDKLQLLTSSNCGATWIPRWTRTGSTLASVSATGTTPFVPAATEYTSYTVNLGGLVGTSGVLFRWIFTADATSPGNNLYIDDINILKEVGIEQLENQLSFTVAPNPTPTGRISIYFNSSEKHSITAEIMDITGKVIETLPTKAVSEGENSFTMGENNQLSQGIYMLRFCVDGQCISKKIVVE